LDGSGSKLKLTTTASPFLQQFTSSQNFHRCYLVCALGAIGLWELFPWLSWQPLVLGLLPYGLDLLAGNFYMKRTPFRLPISIFLLSAGLGVWTAYDPNVAWPRFWLIISAALLFLAVLQQRPADLWLLAYCLAILGIIISSHFLLTYNWEAGPRKIEAISRLGILWMKVRPTIQGESLYPNFAAGIVMALFPFALAAIVHTSRKKRYLQASFWGIGSLLCAACMVLSATRGIWISFMVVAVFLSLWAACRWLAHRLHWRPAFLLALILLPILAAGAAFFILFAQQSVSLLNSMPGPAMAENRLLLQADALRLIQDFRFTGAGLGTFSGLYGHYIRVTPNFIILHAHNIYLDVTLEQSPLGLIALVWIFLLTIWVLIDGYQFSSEKLLSVAALTSLLMVMIHGLASDDIYYSGMAFILFLAPGIASVLALEGRDEAWKRGQWINGPDFFSDFSRNHKNIMMIGLAGSIMVAFFIFHRPLLSAWYANLGAVDMARYDLRIWQTGKWDDGKRVEDLVDAQKYFDRALQFNPKDQTANHRTGLIALINRDFPRAVAYLRAADISGGNHAGVRKTLGYAYTWAGRVEEAAAILREIPEASTELGYYIGWWEAHDRPDLASNARSVLDQLKATIN
jgi:hypothetical protein